MTVGSIYDGEEFVKRDHLHGHLCQTRQTAELQHPADDGLTPGASGRPSNNRFRLLRTSTG